MSLAWNTREFEDSAAHTSGSSVAAEAGPDQQRAPLQKIQKGITIMKIFKVEAQGDTMYFKAKDQAGAQGKLFKMTGPIPVKLLKWTQVQESDVPEDEEIL